MNLVCIWDVGVSGKINSLQGVGKRPRPRVVSTKYRRLPGHDRCLECSRWNMKEEGPAFQVLIRSEYDLYSI